MNNVRNLCCVQYMYIGTIGTTAKSPEYLEHALLQYSQSLICLKALFTVFIFFYSM